MVTHTRAANVKGKPKPLHEFAKSFRTGEVAEKIVSTFLESEGWTVLPVSQTGGRNKGRGDVRIFREDQGPDSFGMEIKCDKMAAKTGNFFIETEVIYDDRGSTPGWARYTNATYIAWYLPERNAVLIGLMKSIAKRLPEWEATYPVGEAENSGNGHRWVGVGTLVPVREVARLCKYIKLGDDYERLS